MADSAHPVIELWKYPLAVLSIFIALVGAKFILGVPFGALSEITRDGVKFTQDAKGEIASLSAQVNALAKAMDELKKQTPEKALTDVARSDIFEASQTVSTQTAQLASVEAVQAQKGYLWIGDYDRKQKAWTRIKLVSTATNAPPAQGPDSITPGSSFTVSANMVLRDGLPANDVAYFQARKSLGVLPTGTRIVAQGKPVAIDREFAVQYWLEVAVQR